MTRRQARTIAHRIAAMLLERWNGAAGLESLPEPLTVAQKRLVTLEMEILADGHRRFSGTEVRR